MFISKVCVEKTQVRSLNKYYLFDLVGPINKVNLPQHSNFLTKLTYLEGKYFFKGRGGGVGSAPDLYIGP
jgi:hypothetical protein